MTLESKLISRFCAKPWLPLVAFILMSNIIVTPIFAAPITFNTALPVAKGEGILRVQSKYIRSTDDPSPLDRKLRVWAFPIVGVYGVTEKLALFSIVPILDKNLDVTTPTGRKTRETSGLGDVTIIARYTLLNWDKKGQTFRLAPFIAMETPTGDDDKKDSLGQLPQPLQLGSGSWDPSIGMVMTRQTLNWQIDASSSYKFNTEANDFEFGDVARLDLSYQYRLWPRHLGTGVPSFIYGVLESNLIWEDRNKVGGSDDKNSGGTTLFFTPGIQYVAKRFVIEAAVQLPVVQDLNGNALENDLISTLSLRINF